MKTIIGTLFACWLSALPVQAQSPGALESLKGSMPEGTVPVAAGQEGVPVRYKGSSLWFYKDAANKFIDHGYQPSGHILGRWMKVGVTSEVETGFIDMTGYRESFNHYLSFAQTPASPFQGKTLYMNEDMIAGYTGSAPRCSFEAGSLNFTMVQQNKGKDFWEKNYHCRLLNKNYLLCRMVGTVYWTNSTHRQTYYEAYSREK